MEMLNTDKNPWGNHSVHTDESTSWNTLSGKQFGDICISKLLNMSRPFDYISSIQV